MSSLKTHTRLVIGNWKMNGTLVSNTTLLAGLVDGVSAVDACELVVCVPFPYLAQAAAALPAGRIALGAQDVSSQSAGAYTGEVAAAMLIDIGVTWVLVGHSERRSQHGETSQLVADKAQAALDAGLTPVVCVGETLSEHDAGQALAVIAAQLQPVLALGAQAVAKMVIAYEPVWAIGTGQTATPQQAQEVHASIRASLVALGVPQVRILYGGSVTAANAASLFSMSDINGALVGGASLVAEEFLRIAAA
ncbi:triose-phosphate isomerase [Alcaligenaceae bacterium]|nr:triose-phosphate isomerase [Alcaligenaceae bacterium]